MSEGGYEPSGRWWCADCAEGIDGSEVTFDETHGDRAGGCGGRVVPCEPDEATS